MLSFQIEFADIFIRYGDYVVELQHIGHAQPLKPWHVIPHTHTIYELHCISEGTGILYTPSSRYTMTAGTTCLTGPGIYHGQSSGIENSMDEYCIRFNIEYKPQAFSEASETQLIKSIVGTPFFVTQQNLNGCDIVDEMIHESYMQLPGYKIKLTYMLTNLLTNIGRFCANISGSCEKMKDCSATEFNRIEIGDVNFKSKIDTYFFHYDAPVSIDQIISELHITKRHFSRLMQKYYGMSYIEKINELRIEYAKQLLIESNMPINAISSHIGFNKQQYFVRNFKNQTGMTPSEYRLNQLNQKKNTM